MIKKYMLKIAAALTVIMVVVLEFCGCGNNSADYTAKEYFAMDTFITVKAKGVNNKDLDEVYSLIKDIESVFSRTIETSEISRLNLSETPFRVSEECAGVLKKLNLISLDTHGAFNPCVGALTDLWDVNGEKYVPTKEEISGVLPLVEYGSYEVANDGTVTKENTKTLFDLGAAVKGYAAEQSISKLKSMGVSDAMISIGGNIAVCGSAPGSDNEWTVGIKNPFYPDSVAGYVKCTDTVVSVSGDYERYFEKDGVIYHHIFDSSTGYPADSSLKSVAVFARDGLVSDALSTALFVMGTEKALEFYSEGKYDFEAVLFDKSGAVYLTDGLKDSFVLFEDAKHNENNRLYVSEH